MPPGRPGIRAAAAGGRAPGRSEVGAETRERPVSEGRSDRDPSGNRYRYLASVAWPPVSSPSPPEGTAPLRAAERRPLRLSRTARIGLGLLLTLVGLFLLVILFPTSPSAIATVVPVAAAGIVALLVGGILLGQGSRS